MGLLPHLSDPISHQVLLLLPQKHLWHLPLASPLHCQCPVSGLCFLLPGISQWLTTSVLLGTSFFPCNPSSSYLLMHLPAKQMGSCSCPAEKPLQVCAVSFHELILTYFSSCISRISPIQTLDSNHSQFHSFPRGRCFLCIVPLPLLSIYLLCPSWLLLPSFSVNTSVKHFLNVL